MNTHRRTIVLHTGALGDFLLACPALQILAQHGPLELVGHPERHAIAVAAGLAERVHPLDALGLHEVFADPEAAALSPPARLCAFLQPFDAALLWMRDPDALLERTFRAAGVARVRCAPGLPQGDWQGHATAYYLHTLGEPETASPQGFRLNLGGLPDPPHWDVVVQPGSGSPKKNWPIAHFFALTQALQAHGCRVGWLLGPAEEEFPPPPGAEQIRESDLVRLGRELAAARLFIGNDTGTTHLAALVGCPTIALFGNTDPVIWGPLGPRAMHLHGSPWPTLESVLDATRHYILTT